MNLLVVGRVTGSVLIICAYFVILHISTLYGAMIELKKEDYYECNIGEVNPILPPVNLSYLYQQADQQFLNF